MNNRQVALVVIVGFAIGIASLFSSIAALGASFVNGWIVGMITASTSDRFLHSLGRAVAWGCTALVIASAVVLLAKLATSHYADLAWPIAPGTAVGVIWSGGGLMILFWLLLGSL